MDQLIRITAPKETVNDDAFIVVDVLLKNGEQALAGQKLVVLESSKASIDVEVNATGYVFHRLEVGSSVPVGGLLAVVSPTSNLKENPWGKDGPENTSDDGVSGIESAGIVNSKQQFSKSAEKLIAEKGLDRLLFAGFPLVTKDIVERILSEQKTAVSQDKKDERETVFASIPKNGIIIVGGGGHAGMCIDILRRIGKFDIVGVLDRTLPIGTMITGVRVIGRDEDLSRLRDKGVCHAINAVGAVSNHTFRERLYHLIRDKGFIIPTIVHPSAVVEPSAHLEEGSQIMAGAIVGSNVVVGKNCIINSGAVVSHDSMLADNVHIAPGAILGGGVTVGSNTLVGMGVTVFLGIKIGANVVIPNGTHVFRDVADNTNLRHSMK